MERSAGQGRSKSPQSNVDKRCVARELAPAGVRSAPWISGAATQPRGSKLPRHGSVFSSLIGVSHFYGGSVSGPRSWATRR
ncbi:hypothetical protein EXW72_26030 [Pseudomonas sp. BCA14]|nr:hypothetical protein EXW70_27550 [Pseudomonas sp. JMN1]TFF04572.1 hypothetical protein EXW71_26575 [Pseudomonas sp. BCA17]TFF18979.1 hypothetical protein EXW72_26030 [Pseudomonas sp. BCA14]TFF20269.1 hypothetical protein EXW73_24385 [Pseudomonas sp. BCA13]